uniref:Predicted protein n=1 Tax=Hordeum vulgare subsp. vulgare TaxID=112509 RepID=F2ECY3_HORVV|nr:predicted protein [Hordeum vulgare subsp. vulgare]
MMEGAGGNGNDAYGMTTPWTCWHLEVANRGGAQTATWTTSHPCLFCFGRGCCIIGGIANQYVVRLWSWGMYYSVHAVS